jgi:Phage integrase, N-terminal SAM-like domain
MTKEQTMTPLRTRMIEDMKLAGLAAKTQEVYLQAVTSLVKHYDKRSPELLTEEEVRRYLLDVRERNARGSFKTCHYGIQFFYRNTLGKDWGLFKKRFDFRSKSVCRRRSPMARCDAFSMASAIRYTGAVSA